jgi:hypothetical protein
MRILILDPLILHYIKGPCNILANNLSRLYHLVTPAQIAEGKKLVEPAEVSNEEGDEAYCLDQEYSGLYLQRTNLEFLYNKLYQVMGSTTPIKFIVSYDTI